MKDPKCTICGGPHYKTFCRQAVRKPLQRSAIKKPTYEEAILKAFKARESVPKPQWNKLPPSIVKPLKRTQIASQSNTERAILIRKADRLVSTYIRRKHAVRNIATCVTCGKRGHYKNMQNGHYISRRIMSLRFEEMNCHVQCKYCNETLGGNLKVYRQYMLQKYGTERTEALEARARNGIKISTPEIQDVVNKFTYLVNHLDK